MWIKPIECVGIEQDLIKLQVPNKFVLNWIEEHFLGQIQENIWSIGGDHFRVQLSLAAQVSTKTKKGKKEEPTTSYNFV